MFGDLIPAPGLLAELDELGPLGEGSLELAWPEPELEAEDMLATEADLGAGMCVRACVCIK